MLAIAPPDASLIHHTRQNQLLHAMAGHLQVAQNVILLMPIKVYVTVLAVFDNEGKMRHISLKWEDGTIYVIDKVTDIRCAAALKAGGQGDRYAIRVKGQEKYLFFEHQPGTNSTTIGRWLVERRQP